MENLRICKIKCYFSVNICTTSSLKIYLYKYHKQAPLHALVTLLEKLKCQVHSRYKICGNVTVDKIKTIRLDFNILISIDNMKGYNDRRM